MAKVVTHDGKFHPDEIFASVLLEWFLMEPLTFIRTRNETSLKRYKESKWHWVIDVGAENNPEMMNFDHHQASFTDVGENGDTLSSCGMIWRYIKDNEQFRKMNPDLSDFVIKKITDFTIAVDRHDNGVEYFKETDFISMYNYANYDSNVRFKKAYRAADAYFFQKLHMWKVLDQIDKLEDAAIAQAENGIIYSDGKLGVSEKLNCSGNQLLVCERAPGEFSITSMNALDVVDFSVRCPSPKEWAGLSGKEIQAFDPCLVFSHKNRFLTVVKGTKDDAMRIANMIIESKKAEQLAYLESIR